MIEKTINEYNWDAMSVEMNEEQRPPPYNPEFLNREVHNVDNHNYNGQEQYDQRGRHPKNNEKSSAVLGSGPFTTSICIPRYLASKPERTSSILSSEDSTNPTSGVVATTATVSNEATDSSFLEEKNNKNSPRTKSADNWDEAETEQTVADFNKAIAQPSPSFSPPKNVQSVTIDEEADDTTERSQTILNINGNQNKNHGTKHNRSSDTPLYIHITGRSRFARAILCKLIFTTSHLAVAACKKAKSQVLLIDKRHHISGNVKKSANQLGEDAKNAAHKYTSFVKHAPEKVNGAVKRHQVCPRVKRTAHAVGRQLKRTSHVAAKQSFRARDKSIEFGGRLKHQALLVNERYNVTGKAKETAHRVAIKGKKTARTSASFVKQASESARNKVKKHQVCPQVKRTAQVVGRRMKKASDVAVEQSVRAKDKVVEFNKQHQIGSKTGYVGRMLKRQSRRASQSIIKSMKRTF